MRPVYQTIFKPPLGNCMQACLASLLEVSLENIPNFAAEPSDKWWEKYCDWMVENYRLQPLTLNVAGTEGVDEESVYWIPRGYHMIQGESPRGNYDHVVVGYEGEIIHDPFPEGGGLKSVKYYEVFVSILKTTESLHATTTT